MTHAQIQAIFGPAMRNIEKIANADREVMADINDFKSEADAKDFAALTADLAANVDKAKKFHARNDQAALEKQIKSNPEFWI